MNVLVFVNYQGKQYKWDDLTNEEKKKMMEKLNRQTADQLGYVEVNERKETCSS